MKSPHELESIAEVIEYWGQCLELLVQGRSEHEVARRMVGVVSNPREAAWSSDPLLHPAYPLIFELAASLELPDGMTSRRSERWDCIQALLRILEEPPAS